MRKSSQNNHFDWASSKRRRKEEREEGAILHISSGVVLLTNSAQTLVDIQRGAVTSLLGKLKCSPQAESVAAVLVSQTLTQGTCTLTQCLITRGQYLTVHWHYWKDGMMSVRSRLKLQQTREKRRAACVREKGGERERAILIKSIIKEQEQKKNWSISATPVQISVKEKRWSCWFCFACMLKKNQAAFEQIIDCTFPFHDEFLWLPSFSCFSVWPRW